MRLIGTSHQLAARQAQALVLLQQGHVTARVAEMVGVTPHSVQRWRRSALQPRHKRKQNLKSLHRPCRLTLRQLKQLEKALRPGALAYGYAEDYWTLDRIAHVIWRLFGVRYRPSGVWRLLHRMEWSCQKPQRISFQHDDEKIAHWKRYIWPRIKKVA
jgi:transposase